MEETILTLLLYVFIATSVRRDADETLNYSHTLANHTCVEYLEQQRYRFKVFLDEYLPAPRVR